MIAAIEAATPAWVAALGLLVMAGNIAALYGNLNVWAARAAALTYLVMTLLLVPFAEGNVAVLLFSLSAAILMVIAIVIGARQAEW
ncbi:MAG: hypothetical protein WD333_02060 [Dehalococcoidia bacterium]